jgi:multiple sugar transport system ATP-binding protein
MRAEIHKLQRALQVTTIYVTHDQVEAMTMGDRVAVMLSGHLQQVGTPESVYERPANQFVAGFIGSPAMNMIPATLTRTDDGLTVAFGDHRLAVDDAPPALRDYEGGDVVLGIRPEDFEDAALVSDDVPANRRLATVCSVREALGSEVLVHFPVAAPGARAGTSDLVDPLDEPGSVFVARVNPRTHAREGKPIELAVDTRRLHFFEPSTGMAIDGARSSSPIHDAARRE